MKRILTGTILVACALVMGGWGQSYDENKQREDGEEQSNKTRQQEDEIIKSAQGDGVGRRAIHNRGPLEDDDRGRF